MSSIVVESLWLRPLEELLAGILFARQLELQVVATFVVVSEIGPVGTAQIDAVAISARWFHRASGSRHEMAASLAEQLSQRGRLFRLGWAGIDQRAQQLQGSVVETVEQP